MTARKDLKVALIALFIASLLLSCPEISGQNPASKPVDSREFTFYFRHDAHDIDPSYRSNSAKLQSLKDFLGSCARIDSIRIVSSSSPEGVYEHNLKVSRLRASSLKAAIRSIVGNELSDSQIHTISKGEDWDGFRSFISTYYYGPDRAKVLSILNSSVRNDTKKWRLQQLSGGRTYKSLIYNFSYRFRTANSIMVYGLSREHAALEAASAEPSASTDLGTAGKPESSSKIQISTDPKAQPSGTDGSSQAGTKPKDTSTLEAEAGIKSETRTTPEAEPQTKPGTETQTTLESEPEAKPQTQPQTQPKTLKTIAALKTNLLLDAASFINYSIEVPIGERISILAQSYNPWWMTRNRQICNQTITIGGEARLYLGDRSERDRLTGHSIGICGFSGKGDWRWRRKICYQAYIVSAGLSYSYATPIGKYLNLEFSISAGWARINYDHYLPSDDFTILYRDHSNWGALNYFGPTKAEISLVLPIRANIGGPKR